MSSEEPNLSPAAISPRGSPARPPLVRVGAVQGIDQALRHFGCNADAVFGDLDLDPRLFRDGDKLVGIPEIARLLEHCARVTGCRYLPFHLAEHQDPSFLGNLGLLLQTAATLGELLEELQLYHQIHIQGASWQLETRGKTASLNILSDASQLTGLQDRLVVELALAQAWSMSKLIAGMRIPLERVRVRSPAGPERREYQRFFRAPVAFGSDVDGLDLPIEVLDRPVLPGNRELHELVRQRVAGSTLCSAVPDLAGEVRTIVRYLLPTGQCSIERVARCYGCDKRTLQRCLRRQCNTTYQALLDAVRFEMVTGYLRDTNISITQVADVAGYTDNSNFARAFRQHFGVSPRQWRSRHAAAAA